MNQNWQGHYWSRSQDEDCHTYMILSSPEPLSSTSPLSLNDHQSPTRLSKSAAAHGVLQLDQAEYAHYLDNSQAQSSRLSRGSMPANTFNRTHSHPQESRKATYSRVESAKLCDCDQLIDVNRHNEIDNDCHKHDGCYSCQSHSRCSYRSIGQEENQAPCPLEISLLQGERTLVSQNNGAHKNTRPPPTLSSTPEEDPPNRAKSISHERQCSCSLLTDDSSVNPSPELRGATTLESISDDQGIHMILQRKDTISDLDADRKDSNTSNVTDVSGITTTSNVSTMSNVTESSAVSGESLPAAYVRRKSNAGDQFSLIESYPPKERRKLQKEVGSAGSDTSGSGPSPPPVRGAPASATQYQPPPSGKLSRQNSRVGLGEVMKHKHTMSLTHLDSRKESAKKDPRTSITP